MIMAQTLQVFPFYDRTVAPSNSLNTFANTSIKGLWTLTIEDTAPNFDDGLFNRAQLNLDYSPTLSNISGQILKMILKTMVLSALVIHLFLGLQSSYSQILMVMAFLPMMALAWVQLLLTVMLL